MNNIIKHFPISSQIFITRHFLNKFQLESKIMVALGGVVIVFSSVASAVGICAYIGLKTTLLTIEVVPFFVLAVGVDNMFIMVQSHQNKKRYANDYFLFLYFSDIVIDVGNCQGNVICWSFRVEVFENLNGLMELTSAKILKQSYT